MLAFTLFFDLLGIYNFQPSSNLLKVSFVKPELIYKKRKPIFCASNTLLFNSAAINTHLDGKHPEQLQNHSYHHHLFYFGPRAKRKQKQVEYLSRFYYSGTCLLTHTKNTHYRLVPKGHQHIILPFNVVLRTLAF